MMYKLSITVALLVFIGLGGNLCCATCLDDAKQMSDAARKAKQGYPLTSPVYNEKFSGVSEFGDNLSEKDRTCKTTAWIYKSTQSCKLVWNLGNWGRTFHCEP